MLAAANSAALGKSKEDCCTVHVPSYPRTATTVLPPQHSSPSLLTVPPTPHPSPPPPQTAISLPIPIHPVPSHPVHPPTLPTHPPLRHPASGDNAPVAPVALSPPPPANPPYWPSPLPSPAHQGIASTARASTSPRPTTRPPDDLVRAVRRAIARTRPRCRARGYRYLGGGAIVGYVGCGIVLYS